jgi:hypothetical protein
MSRKLTLFVRPATMCNFVASKAEVLDESKRRLARDLTIAVVGALIGALATDRLQSNSSKRQTYVASLAQHDQATMYAKDEPVKYWNVSFENACEAKVYVAFAYVASDGNPVVEGWRLLKSHETRPVFKTAWASFGFTVDPAERGFKWAAGNSGGQKDVTNLGFEYIDNRLYHLGWYVLPGNLRKATFQNAEIPAGTPPGNLKAVTIACSRS